MRVTKYSVELNEEKHVVLVKESAQLYQPSENSNEPCKQLLNAEQIVHMLNECFRLDKKAEEYVYLLAFSARMQLLGVFELSRGTVDASFCNTREIFIRLLLCGATNFVIAHNHPSGDASPSAEDIKTMRRIREASQIMGVNMCDSIIIGEAGTFHSFCDAGEL